MARPASNLPADPVVVATNADEDWSPGAFASFIADLLAGPEPELESIGAADALRQLRADADA